MRVELVTTEKPSPQVAFGLLPQPSALPTVQVIGGSPGGLAELSAVMTQLAAARIPLRPMVPAESLKLLPTQMPALDAAELQQATHEIDVSLVGAGLKLTSQIQILLDRWMTQDHSLVIGLDEMVPLTKTHPALLDQTHIAWLVSIPQLVRLAVGTDRRARLNHEESVHNVARLMEAQSIKGPWMISYTTARVYVWLPDLALCLHAPIPAGLSLQEVRSSLGMILCLTVLRKRTNVEPEVLWRVALWLVQQLRAGVNAKEQLQAVELALEAAAE